MLYNVARIVLMLTGAVLVYVLVMGVLIRADEIIRHHFEEPPQPSLKSYLPPESEGVILRAPLAAAARSTIPLPKEKHGCA